MYVYIYILFLTGPSSASVMPHIDSSRTFRGLAVANRCVVGGKPSPCT